MKKAFDDYLHLAGSARGGSSLWEGPDHLLVIDTMPLFGCSEHYKRIDYAKIETLSYGRTSSFWWTLAWQFVLLALLVTGVIFNVEDTLPAAVVFGIVALLVVILLTVHIVRGPTCICRLQTAVQVLKLKPLNRIRRVEKVLPRLRQLCVQHQGGLEATSEALLSATATTPLSQVVAGSIKPAFPGSLLVTLALLMLLPAGALTMAEPFVDNFAFFFADCLVGLIAHTLAIIGLALIFRYQTPASVKLPLWGAGANLIISFVMGYTMLIFASYKQVEAATHSSGGVRFGAGAEFSVWQWMSHASFDELGWLAWVFVVTGALDILCALVGLPAALRPRAKGPAAPSPPPTPPSSSLSAPSVSVPPTLGGDQP